MTIEYTQEFVERGYNNRAAVPDHPRWLAHYPEASARARAALAPKLDLRLGPGPKETLDLFLPPHPAKGTFVFWHGGYWRALDKSDFSFVAPQFVARGYAVAVANYDLCPERVGRDDRRRGEARGAVWLAREGAAHGANPDRMVVGGHSAGGHLAAMLFTTDWAAQGFAREPFLGGVSVVRRARSRAHGALLLQRRFQAGRARGPRASRALASRALFPRPAPACGWRGQNVRTPPRQTQTLWDAWPANRPAGASGPLLICDRNHFNVVVDFSEPDSELTRATLALFE